MKVSVALDGERRRNLEFFSGDDTVIDLTVYAKDGDETPIAISDPQILYGLNGMTTGGSFRADFNQREPYSIVGYINAARTTVAYGLLIRKWVDYGNFNDGLYEPLFVRNEVSGGVPGSYFEGPGLDGGAP